MAANRIRSGIQRYNRSLGNTSGYHETITLSGIAILIAFLKESPTNSSLEELANEAAERFGCSDYLPKHFTKERLFCESARNHWVEPDRTPIGEAGSIAVTAPASTNQAVFATHYAVMTCDHRRSATAISFAKL
ncbi:MAG: hypothetical protein K8R36_12255 [Planctomycetales bacterium]|nr:hypothetical protein [Planctomycetales bacterium]